MIVIPPSTAQEAYFRDLAETTWSTVENNKREECDSLKAENNTIVITCKMEMEGDMESSFHLHYRYYKSKLYCFIEEDDPIKKSDNQ
jgi:hypothetical protein